MNHTPGPWVAKKDTHGVLRLWSADDCDIAALGGDGSLDDEEEAANARLIAAAPDLLAALKKVDAFLEMLPMGEALQSQIRPLVARAEGRS